MIGMIGHPKRLCNDLRDTCTGPQRGIKAGRLGTRQQKLLQLLLVWGAQLTASTRMRFGFQPLGTVFFLQLLPPMHRGGGGLDQTGYFVDAFAFVKQRNRPLAAIFKPIGTSFRSHINEYITIPLKMQRSIRSCTSPNPLLIWPLSRPRQTRLSGSLPNTRAS